jgi:hypothetical protein
MVKADQNISVVSLGLRRKLVCVCRARRRRCDGRCQGTPREARKACEHASQAKQARRRQPTCNQTTHTPMAAPTVFENVADEIGLEGIGQLFAGKKFWVAQRVPSRNRLLDDIKANSGEIVLLEKQADYIIADHFRRDCPPGSISYEFVTKSIREGRVCDPQDHLAGPPVGEAREPGALHRPAKSGRAAYTPEEDRILYKWVRDCEAAGGAVRGNEIYKQLGAKVCANGTPETNVSISS